MGNTYMFGRIVSLFGRKGVSGRKGMNRMMKFMMLNAMMKGKEDKNSMLPMMMMMSGKDDLFSGLFDDMAEEEED